MNFERRFRWQMRFIHSRLLAPIAWLMSARVPKTDGFGRFTHHLQVPLQATGTASGFSGRAETPWPSERLFVLAAFALTYLVVTLLWGTRLYLAMAYLVMSLACAMAYWLDKTAAQTGQWRISESTLLILGALGGWPGAIIAQQTLRHKTSKASFQASFWFSIGLNVLAFLALTTPLGRFIGT